MEEKMLILKMLQEGKITVEEAVRLLEALEKPGTKTASEGSRINELKDELTSKLSGMKIDEKLNKFGEKATKLAETLGEKASKLAEQLSENMNTEKIGYSTERFTEEFTKRMESLGQDISEAASRFADAFANQLSSILDIGFEKYKYSNSYILPLAEKACVYLKASNFSVKAVPSNSKELTVNVYVNSNIPKLNIDKYFKVITENDGCRITSEFPGRSWGKIEVQLPQGIDVLNLSTENAKCELNGIETRLLNCSTTNGPVLMSECSAEEIEILTDNEKVILDRVSSGTANIRTSNARISIEESRLDKINAKTSNGSIIVNISQKGKSPSCDYVFNTTNGKIEICVGKAEGYEYMVDAHTTMGTISVNLPNLTYEADSKNSGTHCNTQLKSEGFDTAAGQVAIKANTSNAPIRIW